jgi:hypothetical protein
MAESIKSVVGEIYDDFTNDREMADLDEKLKRLGCLMRKADVEKNSKKADEGIKKLNELKKTDIPGQLSAQQKGYLKKIKEFTSKHSNKMWRYKNVYSKKCAKLTPPIDTGGKGVLGNLKDAGAAIKKAANEAMDKVKKKAPEKKEPAKKKNMREEMPAYLLNAITKEKPAHPVYGKLRY